MSKLLKNEGSARRGEFSTVHGTGPVSYTHLDVYKRQVEICPQHSVGLFGKLDEQIDAQRHVRTLEPVSYTHLFWGTELPERSCAATRPKP